MANRIKGEIALQHEGRDYVMVLDFNALADFEEEAGIENALDELADKRGLNARKTRALFWCGLKQRHPEMTRAQAGSILSANLDKLGEALSAAFPDPAEGEAPVEGKAKGAAKPRSRR